MAVIIVEHRLDIIATLAKKAIVLEKGKIISQGTIKKVLNDEKVMISGVGLPCSVNIRNSLINEGINLNSSIILMNDLIKKINMIVND